MCFTFSVLLFLLTIIQMMFYGTMLVFHSCTACLNCLFFHSCKACLEGIGVLWVFVLSHHNPECCQYNKELDPPNCGDVIYAKSNVRRDRAELWVGEALFSRVQCPNNRKCEYVLSYPSSRMSDPERGYGAHMLHRPNLVAQHSTK